MVARGIGLWSQTRSAFGVRWEDFCMVSDANRRDAGLVGKDARARRLAASRQGYSNGGVVDIPLPAVKDTGTRTGIWRFGSIGSLEILKSTAPVVPSLPRTKARHSRRPEEHGSLLATHAIPGGPSMIPAGAARPN